MARVIVPERDGTSFGSGTLVDVHGEYGLVITNWHVVSEAAGPVTVQFPDGFRTVAKTVKTDSTWDLAAIVIWKPNAAPVPLAAAAPKIGDPLTIAGYGRGDYRAARGTCTQFVAPSELHPYEIVELSAAARQGDSGGPIFNSRGELAGVLFGEAYGTTSGSHSERVRAFLASVLPDASQGRDRSMIASRPDSRPTPMVAVERNAAATSASPAGSAQEQPRPAPTAEARPAPSTATSNLSDRPTTEAPSPAGEPIPLLDAGTWGQIKTFLVAVGGMALILKIVGSLRPKGSGPDNPAATE